MTKKSKVNPTIVKQLTNLRLQGYTIRELERIFKVRYSTISYWTNQEMQKYVSKNSDIPTTETIESGEAERINPMLDACGGGKWVVHFFFEIDNEDIGTVEFNLYPNYNDMLRACIKLGIDASDFQNTTPLSAKPIKGHVIPTNGKTETKRVLFDITRMEPMYKGDFFEFLR